MHKGFSAMNTGGGRKGIPAPTFLTGGLAPPPPPAPRFLRLCYGWSHMQHIVGRHSVPRPPPSPATLIHCRSDPIIPIPHRACVVNKKKWSSLVNLCFIGTFIYRFGVPKKSRGCYDFSGGAAAPSAPPSPRGLLRLFKTLILCDNISNLFTLLSDRTEQWFLLPVSRLQHHPAADPPRQPDPKPGRRRGRVSGDEQEAPLPTLHGAAAAPHPATGQPEVSSLFQKRWWDVCELRLLLILFSSSVLVHFFCPRYGSLKVPPRWRLF